MPTRADAFTPATPGIATALQFFTLLMKGDLDAFAQIWAEDAVQEHPFGFDGLTAALTGRDEVVADYRRMFANRSDMVFTIYDAHQTTDPDCVIIEARGVSRVNETGKIYDNRYVALFRLRDGRIALNRFYFNPLVTLDTFKGVLIGPGLSKQD